MLLSLLGVRNVSPFYAYLDYQFAGELDDGGSTYIDVYFNDSRRTHWANGACNSSWVRPSGWPRTETVNATSFSFGAQPVGDVDVQCGNIDRYGSNRFTLTRFRLAPR